MPMRGDGAGTAQERFDRYLAALNADAAKQADARAAKAKPIPFFRRTACGFIVEVEEA